VTPVGSIGDTAVPAAVRKEGGEADYRAALGFEGLLLDRLSEQLVKDAGLDDSPYASSVGEAFSASLLQGGGLGLAEDLYASLRATERR
jgi:hypothetical protein